MGYIRATFGTYPAGRGKKFYLINSTFFGLFSVYPSDFGFDFSYDTEFAVPKIAYFRQSKVLVGN